MAARQTEEQVWTHSDVDMMGPKDMLLHCARNGKIELVEDLLKSRYEGKLQLDLNCKGDTKSNKGWSPLHLASYFGHLPVVRALLMHGADVDIVNDLGDTPLHKAALTGRTDMVTLLLQYNADVNVINGEGHTPKQMSHAAEVKRLIEAAENSQQLQVEAQLLSAAREGHLEQLAHLLTGTRSLNINCTDISGNTPLHCAAYRNQKEAAVILLQHGADPTLRNSGDQTPLDLVRTAQMRQLLDVKPIKDIQKHVQRFEGLLLRRSRFLGWRSCWVVLERGVLSYFRKRADAASGVKRTGFKYLNEAVVTEIDTDENEFRLKFFDSTLHHYSVPPETSTQICRQRWVNALHDHITFSNHYTQQPQMSDDDDELNTQPLGNMENALQTAHAHQQILEKQISDMTAVLEGVDINMQGPVTQKLNQLRTTSRDMYTAMTHCLSLLTQQEEVRKVRLQQEIEKSRVLQDALHVLATEHHQLESSLSSTSRPRQLPASFCDASDDEFYDAFSGSGGSPRSFVSLEEDNSPTSSSPQYGTCRHTCKQEQQKLDSAAQIVEMSASASTTYRNCLPAPAFDKDDFSVWTILKQCIGKELSKITMPVVFNEPLSFLQRLCEYMDYSYLLDKASASEDSLVRLQYVTAFAVSACSSNEHRLSKPFNPLLGETYELDRPDLGFRIVAEQVSHHPPISAFYAEGKQWLFHGSVHPKLKFWGKSVEIQPKGMITVELPSHGEVYTWQNVNSCVHNIIVGKLWIEQYGEMEVKNHNTAERVILNFRPSGWFGKELHKIDGYVYDKEKNKRRGLYGRWTENMYSVDVELFEDMKRKAKEKKKGKKETSPSPTKLFRRNGTSSNPPQDSADGAVGEEEVRLPVSPSEEADQHSPDEENMKEMLDHPDSSQLWQVVPRPDHSKQAQTNENCLLWWAETKSQHASKYFHFTNFAMTLNELLEGMDEQLPSTDCRFRPDIRLLESGDLDKAAQEKNRLEEKQRAARKLRIKQKQQWTPRWFHQGTHPGTRETDWTYSGGYWERDYRSKDLPDIF
ncbi:oxysterol-binding protein-related protein 1-like isoform X1 [Branchiostoma floridae]|uniref:Oxysterol-binding protein n=1 Tax=Branchiostoma floridae TaxID=7739 RepID=A0A9J7KH98_BRAFL|nr:oxysterol-binding protein-related protein 1-like isoform X1 [Branchiostoma floridae]XP_035659990.1 oxysterol-binding protein-related protein 1-like isoform X2 [Branchiostoma floridae]XP_035659991.1 oxysterol-binding protein-related protein 1-like isoform X1 [Branchiostoma floridae]XP_035659992.1 oxysterol-binding protein-related protein 1-like isoform X1 [Branchiostoma floridae]XP_035659993.1 oxysterol-binding protein-related protein 1-like isoform X1 [Branchiostoma floridae]